MDEWRPKLASRSRHASCSCRIRRRSRSARKFTEARTRSRCRARTRDELYKYAPMLEAQNARRCPICATSTATCRSPIRRSTSISIATRRTRSASRRRAIEDALYSAYGSRQISTIYAPNDEYWVIMEVEPQYQADPATLSLLYVRSSRRTTGPAQHRRASLQRDASGRSRSTIPASSPSVTISFDVAPGVSLGKALDDVKRLADDTAAGHHHAPPSRAPRRRSSPRCGNLGILLVMAILVIYLVLGVLYESFIHPITILSGLPSAGFGALLTLMIFQHGARPVRLRRHHHAGRPGQEKRHHDDRLRARRAAHRGQDARPRRSSRACIIRFRPIMMTTMAALMGTLPIALGHRRGRRLAPPAGRGGRRRTVLLAVADAVHHARHLHLHGVLPRLGHQTARASDGACRSRVTHSRRRQADRRRTSAPSRRVIASADELAAPPSGYGRSFLRRASAR